MVGAEERVSCDGKRSNVIPPRAAFVEAVEEGGTVLSDCKDVFLIFFFLVIFFFFGIFPHVFENDFLFTSCVLFIVNGARSFCFFFFFLFSFRFFLRFFSLLLLLL